MMMNDLSLVKTEEPALLEFIPGTRELLDLFLLDLDVAPVSKQTYERCLKYFIIWREKHHSGLAADRETVLKYKEYLKEERKLSPYTINLYISAVKQFYAWAESKGFHRDITRGIKGIRKPRGFAKDSLTVDQARILLESIDRSTAAGKRDYAVIMLMLYTGLRAIEVVRANINDIGQQGGEVVLWIHGKGRSNKDEFAILPSDCLIAINDYLHERSSLNNTEALFASLSDRNYGQRLTTRTISQIVHKRLLAARISTSRLSAHSLRHSAITFALLADATIQEAQILGRHANIATTMIYAHNIDRLASAPEKKVADLLNGSRRQ